MVVLRLEFLALLAATTQLVSAQQVQVNWGQCAGITYKGPIACGPGFYCKFYNDYFSQCVPGKPTPSVKPTSVKPPKTSSVKPSKTSSVKPSTTSVQPPSTSPPTCGCPTSSSTSSSSALPSPTDTLDAKIKAKGREYFGTATDRNTLSDPLYEAIVIAEYGQVTPENSMKWESTENARGVFTFSDSDFLVDWATKHNKLIRGHTLVWHSQLPAWVSAITDATELTEVIENHVANVAGRYKGKIHHWDVVNEVFNDDGTWRSSVFYNVLGPQFVDIAFRAAKKADPTAKLYINDYNLDYAGPKVNAVVALAQRLIADGVPIDGIGSQAHLILANSAIPYIHQPLATLASTGLEIALTEVDIRMPLPADAAKLAQQKSDFQATTYACIRTPSCVGVTTWGVSDKYSWVPGVFSGEGDALLWDLNFAKKPAYDGTSAALD